MAAINKVAKVFKSYHYRENKPLVLANVYDALTARVIAELPSSEAIATGSYAVARVAGTSDEDLTL